MKTILITGVTSGVGLETAAKFIGLGWNVIGLARTLNRLMEIQSTLGTSFHPYNVDIRNSGQVQVSFSKIQAKFQEIDIFVNNAAAFKSGSFEKMSIQDIDDVIDTNLKGAIYCTYFALKLLRKGSGRIINIDSVAGTHGIEGQSIYCASKYGLDGFSETLGQEVLRNGIKITTIYPGGIDTPLWNGVDNPYPGDKSQILKPSDITSLIWQISELSDNVVMKKMVVFPSNEWH